MASLFLHVQKNKIF
ncbi:hypothetical protein HU200_014501 [Digitaria exilis]|nr:photosystem I subunit VIII [Cladrastis yungchunii]KAF8735173.1 hypothetical protein HU200_014501 [Digitaria exilis]QVL22960.1 photosystem I subunit VIII [Cladrastis yungchunii]UFK62108.1 photosystem I subunit VIII [Betula nigra]